jgi:sarcosine oxidase subunit beta
VLSDELDAPTGFTAAGYLLLATTDEEADRLADYAERHRRYGLATQLLDAAETLAAAPALAPDQVRAGLLQADAGYGDHNLALFAFAAGAGRGGAGVHPFVEVTGIRVDGGRVTGVDTTAGTISTPRVVLAAGPATPRLAALAGLRVGTRTVHLEAIATERLEPFLGPALAMLHVLGYGHQTPRGEFVGGTEQTEMARTEDFESNLYYLRDIAQKFVRVLPRLAGARLVRHWGGLLDTAPDMAPVLGPTDVDGLVLDAGWTYGFVGAPAGGLLLAEYLATDAVPPLLAPFLPERLRTGRFIEEGSLVVVPET